MLPGRVRAAVRFLTDRGSEGVFDPQSTAQGKHGPLDKTVYDVLQEKYPPQRR